MSAAELWLQSWEHGLHTRSNLRSWDSDYLIGNLGDGVWQIRSFPLIKLTRCKHRCSPTCGTTEFGGRPGLDWQIWISAMCPVISKRAPNKDSLKQANLSIFYSEKQPVPESGPRFPLRRKFCPCLVNMHARNDTTLLIYIHSSPFLLKFDP